MTRIVRRGGPSFELALEPRTIAFTAVQPAAASAAAFAMCCGASAQHSRLSMTCKQQLHQPHHHCAEQQPVLTSSLALAHQSPSPSTPSSLRDVTRFGFGLCGEFGSSIDGPTKITEHLFLGAQSDAANFAALQSLGIKRILNVAGECSVDTCIAAKLQVKSVPLRDHSDEDIAAHFDECISFIREGVERGERVLVHCRMGVSRSTTMVIAYLMRYGVDERHAAPLRYGDAFDFVKALRPQVSPNLGFVLSLHAIDRERGFETPDSTVFDTALGLW